MSSIIDPALAKSLIQEFRTQNTGPGGPALKTKEKLFLQGYFIDRESLEAVLSNPNYDGISIYLAKNPDCVGDKDNVFTIVFTGAELNPKFNNESLKEGGAATNLGVPRYLTSGDIYEYTQSCPPACSQLGDPGGN